MHLPCKNSANSNMLTQFNGIFITSFVFFNTEKIVAFVKMVLNRITSEWGGQIWVIVRSPNKWMFHLADIPRLGILRQEYVFHCQPWMKIFLFMEWICDQLIASKLWVKVENSIINKFSSLMKNLVMVECTHSSWNSEEGRELHCVPAAAWAILSKISHTQSV